MDYAVEIRNVTKKYGSVPAVDDISLQVHKGQFLCIIGPSGCGKTTLLRMIAGFVEPSSGDILVNGQSMIGVPAYRRPVNMMFQHYALFPHMTVAQNIGFGLEMRKTPLDERKRLIAEALDLVELPGFEDRSVRELSGGQEQRVALARALVLKPATLLLDEPLGALDQKVRRKMQIELKRIHREIGITFIHVTHDQEEALAMADQIAVMNNSRLEQVGSTYDVYGDPQTPFVADFVGEANSFEGPIVAHPEHRLALELAPGRWAALPLIAGLEVGRQLRVFVRPERMLLGLPEAPGINSFKGTIRDVVFLGDATRCIVAVGDGLELTASMPGELRRAQSELRPGAPVTVGWPIDAAMVFVANQAGTGHVRA